MVDESDVAAQIKLRLTLEDNDIGKQLSQQLNSATSNITSQLNRQMSSMTKEIKSKMSNVTKELNGQMGKDANDINKVLGKNIDAEGQGKKIGKSLGKSTIDAFKNECLGLNREIQNIAGKNDVKLNVKVDSSKIMGGINVLSNNTRDMLSAQLRGQIEGYTKEFSNALKNEKIANIEGISKSMLSSAEGQGKKIGETLGKATKKAFEEETVKDSVSKKIKDSSDEIKEKVTSQSNKILSGMSNQLNNHMHSLSKNLGNKISSMFSSDNLTKSASNLGSKIGTVIGGALVGSFTKSCLDLGSDLTEVQNVVDVTFGNMTEQVNTWSKNAMEQFGLSETVAKKYLGTSGAMAKAFGITGQAAVDMSENVTGLSADVASFYNVSSDEAFTKLKSIFTGETETLKDLGVVMTQTALDQYALNNGFGKTTANMTEQEKVMLRYQFVTSRLADASGDFAKTSDGWANQTRVLKLRFDALKATLGQGLIKVLSPLIKMFNELLGKIQSCADSFVGLTNVMSGKSASLSTIASDATGASSAIDSIGESADKSAKKLKNLANYDELNVISKDTSTSEDTGGRSDAGISGGTSTGGDIDYSNNVASKYIDAIKKSWVNADFTNIGSVVSKKIGNALESIKWTSIKNTAGKLASSLATFLNGFFKPSTFYSTGKTVAQAVNTAIHAKFVFSKKFDFANFGKSLGSGINGYVKNINWKEQLQASKNWGKGTATALNSFLKTTDFDAVGKHVGNILVSNINKAFSFLTNVDYTRLGQSVADSINGFFKSMNKIDEENGLNGWQKAGKSFNSLVKGLINAIATAIKGVTWSKILKAAGDFLGELDLGTVGIIIGAITWKWIGKDAISALFTTWLSKKISPLSLGGVKVDKDAATAVGTTAGGYIAAAIVTAVGAYNITKEICKKIFPDDADLYNMSVGDIIKYLSDTDTDDLKGAAKGIKDTINEGARSDYEEIKDGIGDAIYGAFGIDIGGKKDGPGHKGGIGSFGSPDSSSDSSSVSSGKEMSTLNIDVVVKNMDRLNKLKKTIAGLSNKSIQAKFDAKETAKFKVSRNWWTNTKSKSLTATVRGAMTSSFRTVKSSWAPLSNKAITAKAKGAMTGNFNTLSTKWAGLGNKTVTMTAKATPWSSVKRSFSSLFKSILSYFQAKLVNPLKKAFSGAKNTLGSVFGFSDIKIPAFANGAYLKANTPQLAIVGDNTHEGEFVAPESKLKAAVREALDERGSSPSGETYEIYMTLDGDVVYKTVVKKAQMRKKQTGNTGLT